MSETYEQIFERFTDRALPIFERHRAEIRAFGDRDPAGDLDMEQEMRAREDEYMTQVWPRVDGEWGDAASDLMRDVVQLRSKLEETAYGGEKADRADLIQLANAPEEQLRTLLDTAAATGDAKLRQAVVDTARARGLRGVVSKSVDADPARKAAYEQLVRIPTDQQLADKASGYRHPKASSEALQPNTDARERARLRDQGRESRRAEFFSRG